MLGGGAGEERPAQEVIGRYHGTGFTRWYLAVLAVASLLVGAGRFVETHQWQGLVFAAAWTGFAVKVWVTPTTVISDRGVRFAGRPVIPWSQMVDIVVRPSREGEKRNPPELVLLEGIRKPLSDLDADQVEGLRSLARKNGAPISP